MRNSPYADDTLIFIPGTLSTIQHKLQELRLLFEHYGEVSGDKSNMRECGVVLRGLDWPDMAVPISGLSVQRRVKYFETWLGIANVMEPYQGPLANCRQKPSSWPPLPARSQRRLGVSQNQPPAHRQHLAWSTLPQVH